MHPLNLRKRTVKYDACCGNCDGVAMREGRGNKCSFVKMKRGANILAQDHVTFNMKSSLRLFSVCVMLCSGNGVKIRRILLRIVKRDSLSPN